MKSEEVDRFIESWGSMGVFWGINRSMARIHAFIITSEKPVDLDTISNALNISRGNASMCLKDLRNWGVIQRVYVSGDRRDFYTVEPDIWMMFYRIGVERKKREFDPALNALRHLLSEGDFGKFKDVHEKLVQIEEIFSTVDRILSKGLENENQSKLMFQFLKTFLSK